jgi:hypothetical protein
MFQQISHQPEETGAAVQEREDLNHFPLLKLPRELRLKVYRELLRSENDLLMGDCSTFPCINGLDLGILLTCKQVHDEAVDVLYGENIFQAIPIPNLYPDNRNIFRVRRARVHVHDYATVLGEFLDDHPDLTHLFLEFTKTALEREYILLAVEEALQRHCGLVDLKVHVRVRNPLSQSTIDFCWRLYSVVRRNRNAVGLGVRPEEAGFYDTTTCPFFVKVRNP